MVLAGDELVVGWMFENGGRGRTAVEDVCVDAIVDYAMACRVNWKCYGVLWRAGF